MNPQWIGLTAFVFWASLAVTQVFGQDLGQWNAIDGRVYDPLTSKDKQAVVVVFVSPDCPIANAYQPILQRMADKYADSKIDFFEVHGPSTTTVEEARKHVETFNLKIPVVVDPQQKLARRLKARTTPEAFLLDGKTGQVLYRGKIDNLYEGFGKKRSRVTEHYLRDAIEAVLHSQPIAVAQTESVGCLIEYAATPKVDEEPETTDLAAYYDPLSSAKVDFREFEIQDSKRDRVVPLRVYLPAETGCQPVILLSHGLGGSREACEYLGRHWAGRGYWVIAIQHPGSDESVWKDVPLRQRMQNLKAAANGQNLKLRVEDVQFLLDQLERWNQDGPHGMKGRLNLERIGMSGHSFGAVTTQAICGQRFLGRPMFEDTRLTAALPLSPSTTRRGDPAAAFGKIQMPWLSITGTEDRSPLERETTPDSRRQVYEHLPAGDKYELVLFGAEHSGMGDREGQRLLKSSGNPNHHRAIKAISAAFWDAYLRQKPEAKHWLQETAQRSVLEEKDQWRKK